MKNPIRMKDIFIAAAITLASHSGWAAAVGASSSGKGLPKISLTEANRVIANYRELRDSCSEGGYDDRRVCLNKLSKANPQYRQAKRLVEQNEFNDTAQSTLSLR